MVNKVFLLGRLGKDPAVKHFSNDSAVAEFPLATSEKYKNKEQEWVETTDWHNVKLPNKFMAERAEKYLKKGSLIHVEGKLRTRSYDDKDGNKRYITEVIAESFRMLDKREDSGSSSQSSSQSTSTTKNDAEPQQERSNLSSPADDDLPF